MKKLTWPAAALAVALTLAGCGDREEPPASEPAATETTPSPAPEGETPTEEAEAPAWGNGVWPEGYSFDLPTGIALSEEVLQVPELDEGQDGLEHLPYRQLTLGDGSPLLELPESSEVSLPAEIISGGLEFGARFLLEEFMDSEELLQEQSPWTERQWFDRNADRIAEGTLDYLRGRDMEIREWTYMVSLGADMFRPDASDDADEQEQETASFKSVLHEEGGPRSANVAAELVDASWDPAENLLTARYNTSQTLLLERSGVEPVETWAWKVDTEVEMYFRYQWEEDRWEVWDIRPSYSWDGTRLEG